MPEDAREHERHTVVSSYEAYASDIFPHPTIIEGFQKAIPNGGERAFAIVERQQKYTFYTNLAAIVTNNLIPLILAAPILAAILTGALIEVTIAASVPIGVFTAGSAVGRVVATLRGRKSEESVMLQEPSRQTGQRRLPGMRDRE